MRASPAPAAAAMMSISDTSRPAAATRGRRANSSRRNRRPSQTPIMICATTRIVARHVDDEQARGAERGARQQGAEQPGIGDRRRAHQLGAQIGDGERQRSMSRHAESPTKFDSRRSAELAEGEHHERHDADHRGHAQRMDDGHRIGVAAARCRDHRHVGHAAGGGGEEGRGRVHLRASGRMMSAPMKVTAMM